MQWGVDNCYSNIGDRDNIAPDDDIKKYKFYLGFSSSFQWKVKELGPLKQNQTNIFYVDMNVELKTFGSATLKTIFCYDDDAMMMSSF